MTGLAILFMSSAVLFVIVLTAWCYYHVLRWPVDKLLSGPDPASRPEEPVSRRSMP